MDTKRLPNIIIATCLVALAAWWFWPTKAPPLRSKVTLVRRPPPAEIDDGPPGPTLPPPVAVTLDPPPAPPANDPQTDLSTTITDLIGLLQAGNTAGLLQNYLSPDEIARISPEERAEVEKDFQSPENQPRLRTVLWELQAVQYTQPVYNADKTRATFAPPDGGEAIVFVNINGRWYPK